MRFVILRFLEAAPEHATCHEEDGVLAAISRAKQARS